MRGEELVASSLLGDEETLEEESGLRGVERLRRAVGEGQVGVAVGPVGSLEGKRGKGTGEVGGQALEVRGGLSGGDEVCIEGVRILAVLDSVRSDGSLDGVGGDGLGGGGSFGSNDGVGGCFGGGLEASFQISHVITCWMNQLTQ